MTGLTTTTMTDTNGNWRSWRQASFTVISLPGSIHCLENLLLEEFQGALPLDPEVYRSVPQGLATGISSVSMQQKRAIPYGTAPSEASRRSGRTSALPYPPIAGI